MKNLIRILIPIIILLIGLGCDNLSPSKKVQNAHETATEANQESYDANKAYLKEVEAYKEGIDKKLEAYKKRMDQYGVEVDQQKMNTRKDFEEQIAILESRNAEMKKKLSEYKVERKEDWEQFKKGMDENMIEMDTMFNNLTEIKVVKNNKQ